MIMKNDGHKAHVMGYGLRRWLSLDLLDKQYYPYLYRTPILLIRQMASLITLLEEYRVRMQYFKAEYDDSALRKIRP